MLLLKNATIQFFLAALVIFHRTDSTHVCQMDIKPVYLYYCMYSIQIHFDVFKPSFKEAISQFPCIKMQKSVSGITDEPVASVKIISK